MNASNALYSVMPVKFKQITVSLQMDVPKAFTSTTKPTAVWPPALMPFMKMLSLVSVRIAHLDVSFVTLILTNNVQVVELMPKTQVKSTIRELD